MESKHRGIIVWSNSRTSGFYWKGQPITRHIDGKRITNLADAKKALDTKIALEKVVLAL